MMTKLRIISRLWSHITDLRLYIRGQSSKTLEQIEDELDITEYYCRPYADVDDVDDVLLSSQEGIIIRLHANEIPLQSRYGSGVRVMRLGENDKVMVLARTDHDDEAQTEQIDTSDADAEPTAEQLAAMEAADAAAAAEAPEADDKGEE